METGQVTKQGPGPSQDAIDSIIHLYNSINSIFPEAVTDFESRWSSAQTVCQENETCVETDEFGFIKKLGPKIIQFVVYKLVQDDVHQNLWGVYLYNALENDPDYRVSIDGPDLHGYSARIVELNYERNKIVETRIKAWKQVHEEQFLQASSESCTVTVEYTELWEMGTSIIAPLMLAFHKGQDEYWWDLLHEIIHGHKMGAVQYVKSGLYESWDTYFRRGEHSDAPDYILTPFDRFIKFGERVDDSAPPRRMTAQPHMYRGDEF